MTGYWKKLKYARRQESGSGRNEEAVQNTPLSPCLSIWLVFPGLEFI